MKMIGNHGELAERIMELVDKIIIGIQKLQKSPLHSGKHKGKLPLSHIRMLFMLHNLRKIKMGELAEKLSIPTSTMTEIASRLERNGMIRKERSKEDGRIVFVSLTRKGIDTVNRWRRRRKEALRRMMERMSEEDREMLYKSLASIARIFERLEEGIR
jgi:DNA-binding MarR family transcriptional regulator